MPDPNPTKAPRLTEVDPEDYKKSVDEGEVLAEDIVEEQTGGTTSKSTST